MRPGGGASSTEEKRGKDVREKNGNMHTHTHTHTHTHHLCR